MAVKYVVAVRDSAMQAFANPFFVPATAAAVRSFSDEVNRAAPDNPLYAHPEDFELHCLATFEEDDGSFIMGSHLLVRAKDVKSVGGV